MERLELEPWVLAQPRRPTKIRVQLVTSFDLTHASVRMMTIAMMLEPNVTMPKSPVTAEHTPEGVHPRVLAECEMRGIVNSTVEEDDHQPTTGEQGDERIGTHKRVVHAHSIQRNHGDQLDVVRGGGFVGALTEHGTHTTSDLFVGTVFSVGERRVSSLHVGHLVLGQHAMDVSLAESVHTLEHFGDVLTAGFEQVVAAARMLVHKRSEVVRLPVDVPEIGIEWRRGGYTANLALLISALGSTLGECRGRIAASLRRHDRCDSDRWYVWTFRRKKKKRER
mmetsp:Transcript_13817/g.41632  ORF Transcript_13817/g.41632 Transcript_13817/m.41632 type:complete len:280 (+) Transcript_13817:663-1502(+)